MDTLEKFKSGKLAVMVCNLEEKILVSKAINKESYCDEFLENYPYIYVDADGDVVGYPNSYTREVLTFKEFMLAISPKKSLKTELLTVGRVVETRDGYLGYVLPDRIIYSDCHSSLKSYDDDLKNIEDEDSDIIEVYDAPLLEDEKYKHYSRAFSLKTTTVGDLKWNISSGLLISVWKRDEIPHEVQELQYQIEQKQKQIEAIEQEKAELEKELKELRK